MNWTTLKTISEDLSAEDLKEVISAAISLREGGEFHTTKPYLGTIAKLVAADSSVLEETKQEEQTPRQKRATAAAQARWGKKEDTDAKNMLHNACNADSMLNVDSKHSEASLASNPHSKHPEAFLASENEDREKERKQEKENFPVFPPHPLSISSKEKEINKEKEGEPVGERKKPNRKDVYLSTLEEPWLTPMKTWLDYKQTRGESYKADASLDACLKKLKELASNSPETAMRIIEQSMASNWAGLFRLKDNTTNVDTTKFYGDRQQIKYTKTL